MGRSKVTARRRAPPNDGEDAEEGPGISKGTRFGFTRFPPAELSNALIEYVSRQTGSTREPPRKRQKIRPDVEPPGNNGLASIGKEQEDDYNSYILVKQSNWDIRCPGSKLSGRTTPLKRENIKPFVLYSSSRPIRIDILDEKKRRLYQVSVPERRAGLEDVFLALDVDQDSKKWNGLSTEFGISLFEEDGSDYLRLDFAVKWSLTSSPYDVPRLSNKTRSLAAVLSTYFPDPNVTKADTWSAQDFYTSVHAPDKDQESASLETPEMNSNLYPFQKRAVQWLLKKEGVKWSATNRRIEEIERKDTLDLPISFRKTVDAHDRQCFVSHLFGIVTMDVKPFEAVDKSLKGGILAEESMYFLKCLPECEIRPTDTNF